MTFNAPSTATHLVLVGGGHAHLEVVRRLIVEGGRRFRLTLVSPSDQHHYSGMVPGYLRGSYSEKEIAFDLPPLVERAGGRFVVGTCVGLDPDQRLVHLDRGEPITYDVVSFNVGSRLKGDNDVKVAQHAAVIKPMSRAVEVRKRIEVIAGREAGNGAVRHAAVVGAGAAGFEVSCAIASALDDVGLERRVTILDGSEQILHGYSKRFRSLAERVLRDKSIAVRVGSRVSEVGSEEVRLVDGSCVPSQLTVWLTGPAATPIFKESGLALDPRGFLLVNEALQSVSDPRVFAVGDCATLEAFPETPKAGVYAVRQAPILWKSLVATTAGSPLPRYVPQTSFLSLLNTADGKALLRYKGFVSHSRWAWRLKDGIDRRFMTRYQKLADSR
jgi:pyridine nucleotide-disulfide oxidoreductase family protein